jgi:hypothetical protein
VLKLILQVWEIAWSMRGEPLEITWYWCREITVTCKLDEMRTGIALNKVCSETMTEEHKVWDWGSHSVNSGKYCL